MFTDRSKPTLASFPLSLAGSLFAMVTLLFGFTACDTAGPKVGGTEAAPMSVSFSTESVDPAKIARGPTFSGPEGSTLQLERVEMVIQEMEFDRADGAEDCSSSGAQEADDCEEVESGPVLVSLPLDSGTPDVVIDTTLSVGTWEEAQFEVDEAEDTALEDFPSEVSIRAQGTYTPSNGTERSFRFTSDLSAEKEIEFEPPVEVTPNDAANITFSVDVNTWFRRSDSTLVDPGRAMDGERFEDLVEENIETSIEGFEDNDRDGEEENEEDDGDDDGDDDDGEETEIEQTLNNTGPDDDASGEAEFEKESDRTEFMVEAEDLETGTYDVVVADTTRGEVEVVDTGDETKGEIEFRKPSEEGHPLLDFDPRGSHVAVKQNGTTYLEVDFPSEEDDDGDDDDGDDDDGEETEIEQTLNNTGPDDDASGEAEFEKESDQSEFKVEVEDLETGTYDVVVADTTRGEVEVVDTGDETEGEIEFRKPSEEGHPLLDFDPRGSHVAVARGGTVYLEADFPASGGDDD